MKKLTTAILLTAALGFSVNAASAQTAQHATDLTGPRTQNPVGLLLPAVQAARESARRQPNTNGAAYGGPNAAVGPTYRAPAGRRQSAQQTSMRRAGRGR